MYVYCNAISNAHISTITGVTQDCVALTNCCSALPGHVLSSQLRYELHSDVRRRPVVGHSCMHTAMLSQMRTSVQAQSQQLFRTLMCLLTTAVLCPFSVLSGQLRF